MVSMAGFYFDSEWQIIRKNQTKTPTTDQLEVKPNQMKRAWK